MIGEALIIGVGWTVMFSIHLYFKYGPTSLVDVVMIFSMITVVLLFLEWASIRYIYHHQVARYRMGEDRVVQDLARAMAARGARPSLEVVGKWTWFDLPPLSIGVRRRLWWTNVYVGPTKDGNEREVEGLKAFVERTLGSSS